MCERLDSKVIKSKKRGRPLLLGRLDKKVLLWSKGTRNKDLKTAIENSYLGEKFIHLYGFCKKKRNDWQS